MSVPHRYNVGMYKAHTTALHNGDTIPSGEPKKYKNDRGYVRLRWLVGKGEYVEAYEHRVVMGLPPDDMHVHHINHIKDDNRQENLIVLSPSDHEKLHEKQNAHKYELAKAKRQGYRSLAAFQKASREQKRRASRKARYLGMKHLYEQGYSTVQIGELYNIDSSNVSIHLRQVGTVMRKGPSRKEN